MNPLVVPKPANSVSNHDCSDLQQSFPTSATIPFPYISGPYPQQAALMDTMLRTLEALDHATNGSSTVDTDTASGRVMMLESPTGMFFF